MMSKAKMLMMVNVNSGHQLQRSFRMRTAATTYLSRTFPVTGDKQKWTYSVWLKRVRAGTTYRLFGVGSDNSGASQNSINIGADDKLNMFMGDGAGNLVAYLAASGIFNDPTAWMHIIFIWDTNNPVADLRMRFIVNGKELTSFSQRNTPTLGQNSHINSNITHTIGVLPVNSSSYMDGYLAEPQFISGQALGGEHFGEFNGATGAWVPKKYNGAYGVNGFRLGFSDNSSVQALGMDQKWGAYSGNLRLQGTTFGGFTGYSGNASIFNGVRNNDLLGGGMAPNPPAGYTAASAVGKDWGVGASKTLTAFRLYAPADGGVVAGNATPILFKLQGSHDGATYVDLMAPISTSGASGEIITVVSGITTSVAYRYHRLVFNSNGVNNLFVAELEFYEKGDTTFIDANDWFVGNASVTPGVTNDSLIDVPLGAGGGERGNYAVLNPIDTTVGTLSTLTHGNLTASNSGSGNFWASSTLAPESGKWYMEAVLATGGSVSMYVGVKVRDTSHYCIYLPNAGTIYNNSETPIASLAAPSSAVIGVLLDLDNKTVGFYVNNVSVSLQAMPYITGPVGFYCYTPATGDTIYFNFGQRPFVYPPLVQFGFKALHTGNLPTPAVRNPKKYFDSLKFIGDGTGNRVLTAEFDPGISWLRSRVSSSLSKVSDRVRGNDKALSTESASGASALTSHYAFGAIGSNQVIITNGGSGGVNDSYNKNAEAYINWLWRISAISGVDVVTYNGDDAAVRAIAHSLGVAPRLMLVKATNTAVTWGGWHVYFGGFGNPATTFTRLNETTAPYTGYNEPWGATLPSASHFTVGNSAGMGLNYLGNSYVAYLFAQVAGFSKFSVYLGNGSASGPIIYCGFKPAFLLLRNIDDVSDWWLYDAVRDTYTPWVNQLRPNIAAGESVANGIETFSTGFRAKNLFNLNGNHYLSIAFAQHPSKYALAG